MPIYNENDAFHETFVTLGFLAAVTKTIGLSSGVLISPQRQTGLIAKQAAEVDILSGGRLRLGIGVGWNHVEYEALGDGVEDPRRAPGRAGRGAASPLDGGPRELQRAVSRSQGGQHRAAAGAAADPDLVRRLVGSGGDARRPARRRLDADHGARRTGRGRRSRRLREQLKSFGRDPAKFGIEGWLRMREPDPQRWAAAADGWRPLGADMVMLYPMYRIASVDDHIETLRRFKEVAGG